MSNATNATDVPVYPPGWAEDDKGPAILISMGVCFSIATIFCMLRWYTNLRYRGRLHLDDFFMLLSVLVSWLAFGFEVKAVQFGLGRHVVTLTPSQLSGTIWFTYVGFLPQIMSFAVPKLGVIALLTRLLNPGRYQTVFLWSLGIICFISTGINNMLLFLQCIPVASAWDFSIKEKQCWDPIHLENYAIYSAVISATTDAYLAIYPAIVLSRLNISLKKKVALSIALGLGLVGTIIAMYKSTRLPSLISPDFTYDIWDLSVWTVIEGSAITVAACIPVLQPLVETCLGYRFGGDALGLREKDDSEHGGGRHRIFESDLSPTRHREVRDPNGLSFLNSTKANTNAEITRIASEDPTIDTIVESDGKPGTSSTVETADGIKRTDKYSVSYAGKESVSEEEQQRWKRGF